VRFTRPTEGVRNQSGLPLTLSLVGDDGKCSVPAIGYGMKNEFSLRLSLSPSLGDLLRSLFSGQGPLEFVGTN
jgi:hypothetical protein